jgi:hypothetical protein
MKDELQLKLAEFLISLNEREVSEFIQHIKDVKYVAECIFDKIQKDNKEIKSLERLYEN